MENQLVIKKVKTPIGFLQLHANEKGLVQANFIKDETSESAPKNSGDKTGHEASLAWLKKAETELTEYFAGQRKSFSVPLVPVGTEFQRQCWQALLSCPYGKTISYLEQAKSLKRPKAVRAVGSANGRNPLPIFLPCHRVVREDGHLGGYSGGIELKKSLLQMEASFAAISNRK